MLDLGKIALLLALLCVHAIALPLTQASGPLLVQERTRQKVGKPAHVVTTSRWVLCDRAWLWAHTQPYLYRTQRSTEAKSSSNVSLPQIQTSNLRGPWDKAVELWTSYFTHEPTIVKRGYTEAVIQHHRPQDAGQKVKDMWTTIQLKKVKVTKEQYRSVASKYRPDPVKGVAKYQSAPAYVASAAPSYRTAPPPPASKIPFYKRWWQKLLKLRKSNKATTQDYREVAARYARQTTRFVR